MLPPEIQRIVLLIALAATGYFMILAWNDDMQQAKQAVPVSEAPLSSNGSLPSSGVTPGSSPAPRSVEIAELPVAPSAPPASADVPDSSMVVGTTVQTQPSQTPGLHEPSNLVSVATPTLKVWIDRVGGDIVRVQLPKFPVELGMPDEPYMLLDNSPLATYIAQSGLIGPDGPDASGARPLYEASVSQLTVGPGEERELVLTTTHNGADIRKTFRFRGDEYLFDVEYELFNNTSQTKQAALFAQIKRDSKPPASQDTFALAPRPYLGAAFTTPEERYLKVDFEDIDDDGPLDETLSGGWVAFLQHYFLSAWIAPDEQTNRYSARKSADGTYIFGYTGQLQQVEPGSMGAWATQFYAGPKDQKRLEQIAENLNLTVDYGFLWWVAVPLFYLLDWLYGLVGNWGVAIILLTVVVKAVLYPLSAAGYKSMANMRRVAPAMKRLQERYSTDREKLSKEMMALYKREGANPLGGCLPMLLPMPIFIALYWVLFESVELRQAPFFLWIHDLAVMDPYFILPLLMGASMYWMQTLNPQVGDPMQVKMMKMMPIMFTVLFLFFPAGLVLYWLVNNVLSIAQQQYVYRRAEKAQAASS